MTSMDLKPNSARVTGLSTRFETLPVQTAVGPILWADVRIEYALAGLTPTVDIRVSVPFEADQTEADRKSQAFRSARLLIDHTCQAAGVPPDKPVSESVRDAMEGIIPLALEGIAQELGIATPTAKPKSGGRGKR